MQEMVSEDEEDRKNRECKSNDTNVHSLLQNQNQAIVLEQKHAMHKCIYFKDERKWSNMNFSQVN